MRISEVHKIMIEADELPREKRGTDKLSGRSGTNKGVARIWRRLKREAAEIRSGQPGPWEQEYQTDMHRDDR